ERRPRLWSIEQHVSPRAVDEQAQQPELADRTLRLAGGALAVIGVDRGEAVKTAGMTRDQIGDVIVDRNDRVVRQLTIGIGAQAGRDVDDAGGEMPLVDVLQQQAFIRKHLASRVPSGTLAE